MPKDSLGHVGWKELEPNHHAPYESPEPQCYTLKMYVTQIPDVCKQLEPHPRGGGGGDSRCDLRVGIDLSSVVIDGSERGIC